MYDTCLAVVNVVYTHNGKCRVCCLTECNVCGWLVGFKFLNIASCDLSFVIMEKDIHVGK